MPSDSIATRALHAAAPVGRYLAPHVHERLAIGEAAILVDGMDESTDAEVRLRHLADSIAEIRRRLNLVDEEASPGLRFGR